MDWTPLGALIVSVISLPALATLWYTKADKDAVDTKIDTVNEVLDAHEKDNGHIREWLASHEKNDDDMFKEIRGNFKDLQNQIQHNFELLIMEIKKNGNGSNGRH